MCLGRSRERSRRCGVPVRAWRNLHRLGGYAVLGKSWEKRLQRCRALPEYNSAGGESVSDVPEYNPAGGESDSWYLKSWSYREGSDIALHIEKCASSCAE